VGRVISAIDVMRGKFCNLSKVKRATLLITLCSFLQRGISFITVPIFTRMLSTADYGTVSVYQSWEMVATYLATLGVTYGGFNNGMIKFKDDREGYTSAVAGLVVCMGLLWLVLCFVLSDGAVALTGMPLTLVGLAFIEVVAKGVYDVWLSRMRFDYEYKKLVPASLILSAAVPALGVVFVIMASDKALARILSFVLVEVAFAVVLGRFMLKRGKCFCKWEYWKFTLLFNIPLLPHYLSQVVLTSSDRIMISNLCGSSDAGVYSIAYSVGMLMTLLTNSLNSTVTPWIYRTMDAKEYKKVGKTIVYLLGGIALALLLVDILAPEVVTILAPDEYSEAMTLVPVIAASVFFMFMYSYCSSIEFYYEKTRLAAVASVIAATLNLALNAACIPVFGYRAAGYTTLLCYMVLGAAHYIFSQRVVLRKTGSVTIDGRVMWGLAIVFLAISLVLPSLYSLPLVRYALFAAALIAAFINRENIVAKLKELKAR
jgi:O-antigen/teichoic acid export membrane protein